MFKSDFVAVCWIKGQWEGSDHKVGDVGLALWRYCYLMCCMWLRHWLYCNVGKRVLSVSFCSLSICSLISIKKTGIYSAGLVFITFQRDICCHDSRTSNSYKAQVFKHVYLWRGLSFSLWRSSMMCRLGATVTSAGCFCLRYFVCYSLCCLSLCLRSEWLSSLDSWVTSNPSAFSGVSMPRWSCRFRLWLQSGWSALLQCGVV